MQEKVGTPGRLTASCVGRFSAAPFAGASPAAREQVGMCATRLSTGRVQGPRIRGVGIALLVSLAASPQPAPAQLTELFSPDVKITRPTGKLVEALVRVSAPNDSAWPRTELKALGFAIRLPRMAVVDNQEGGSRRLLARFGDEKLDPRPWVGVDVFRAEPGEPTELDEEYIDELREAYPKQLGGGFETTDSGLLRLKRGTRLALIGGNRTVGKSDVYRAQLTHLSRTRQVFITFEMASADAEAQFDTLARMILSLELK